MVSHILLLAVAANLPVSVQDQPPAFKPGAYVIAIDVPVFEGPRWCVVGSKPITDLTAADFTVSLTKSLTLRPI